MFSIASPQWKTGRLGTFEPDSICRRYVALMLQSSASFSLVIPKSLRADFIRRTPDEYENWINTTSKECEILELQILSDLRNKTDKKIFVDTNICVETLHRISDEDHVMIMLADPDISVKRFFERPDREKQFLYRLLLAEPDPDAAIANFRECLSRINTPEKYDMFMNSGFKVITRDENRTIEETMALIEHLLKL